MDDLLEQFLIEGRELVAAAADDLLALERDPAHTGRIDSAFRAVHTLKGSVGLFDFAPMGEALHAAEDVLSALRAGSLAAERSVLDALLNAVNVTERWIEVIAGTGTLPSGAAADSKHLTRALVACLAAGAVQTETPPAESAAPVSPWVVPLLARAPAGRTGTAGGVLVALRYTPATDCFYLGDDPMALVRAIPDLIFLHIEPRMPWPATNFDPFACNLVIEALSTAPLAAVRQKFRLVADQCDIEEIEPALFAPAADSASARDPGGRILRVDAARVDALSDVVGELVVARNRLAHQLAEAALPASLVRTLSATQADIERLTGDMQRAVLRLRMVPLAATIRRCARLLRDIAARLGKQIVFEARGEEVEADKAVVDGLFEPLLHVLRNAVDHGIEAPEARRGAGKAEAGRVTLTATAEGEQVVISVHDDGAGIDPARIGAVAVTRGVLTREEAGALDDDSAAELLFAAGFSTAASVTDVSGRGVGLDAVRSAVEALGGRVTLTSVGGAGTTIRMSLPRAVIVTTTMTVRAGGERFGVPMGVVRQTARVAVDRILPVADGLAFVLRDRTIPLLRLTSLLGLADVARTDGHAKVLIVGSGEHLVGVEVDRFEERMDVLLRPMAGLLAGVPGVCGTALMGDGNLLMVLDLPELAG